MKITNIPLEELIPNARNVRIHSAKQTEEYKRSLQKFGQIKPIICDENKVIWIGNGLYEAMKALGMKTAACYVKSGMTENDKLKMMMADNKVYELGLTDHDSIDAILKDLDGDFDIPGYDDSLLETLAMSFQETDEFVTGYGTISEDDLESIRQNEAKSAEEAGSPSTTDQASDISEHSQTDGAAGTGLPDDGGTAETGRFVICPKCGERICL